MRSFNGLLIGIVLSLTSLFCTAQENKTIEIPVVLLDSIVDELVVKDHLIYKLNVQDSMVTVYKHMAQNMYIQIEIYKAREQEYNSILYSFEQRLNIVEAEKKDLEKAKNKQKIKSLFIQFGQWIAVAVLTTLLIID